MITIKTKHPNHSIKEAVVAFFVQGSIADAEKFRPLVNGLEYNSFNVIDNNSIQFTLCGPQLQSLKNSVSKGFRMTKYTNGNATEAIQCINQGNQMFTFNNMFYSCWSEFKGNVKRYAGGVCQIEEHPVLAFSLQYIDEFMTVGDNGYDSKDFFNSESSFLPRDFFCAYNINYKSSYEQHNKDNGRYNQDMAIVVKRIGKNAIVTITNSFTFVIDDNPLLMSKLIADDTFSSKLEFAHTKIKDTLGDVLSKEMCNRINLVKP